MHRVEIMSYKRMVLLPEAHHKQLLSIQENTDVFPSAEDVRNKQLKNRLNVLDALPFDQKNILEPELIERLNVKEERIPLQHRHLNIIESQQRNIQPRAEKLLNFLKNANVEWKESGEFKDVYGSSIIDLLANAINTVGDKTLPAWNAFKDTLRTINVPSTLLGRFAKNELKARSVTQKANKRHITPKTNIKDGRKRPRRVRQEEEEEWLAAPINLLWEELP